MILRKTGRIGWLIVFMAVLYLVGSTQLIASDQDRIQIYKKNPHYWQYQGKAILLIGGTKNDNLFQIADLKSHLDLLKSVGGNYIRNTMSSRDEGDLWPFGKISGRYDLNQWNDEYWNRFEQLLKLTWERGIIVQIELWDRFDYARSPWNKHNPYNPRGNVNYNSKQSSLKEKIDSHPGRNENRFFYTVPALDNNPLVLKYQQAQMDKMLEIALRYDHVLYCMDNETSGSPQWGKYWSRYIKDKAEKTNVKVETTEMWDNWDLSDPSHRATFDHPETYSFVDVSQNSHQKGQKHWDNFQRQRDRLSEKPRPMNHVKIYGADGGKYGSDRDGTERFWRNIIGGAASSRFHRGPSGIGLSSRAQSHLKSARLLLAELDIISSTPDSQSKLLSNRDENEAYLTTIRGRQYAVYFPNGGSVDLDLTGDKGRFTQKWLDIARSRWQSPSTITAIRKIILEAPGTGHWLVLLTKNSPDK